jgi:DNA-binding NarL/FixJ family response regulator
MTAIQVAPPVTQVRLERVAHFSPREEQILALIAEGKGNRDIAVALGLSPKTVSSYLSRVFIRHSFRTRTQAALAWVASRPREVTGPG